MKNKTDDYVRAVAFAGGWKRADVPLYFFADSEHAAANKDVWIVLIAALIYYSIISAPILDSHDKFRGLNIMT
jgi:hypothetical protein